MATEPAQGTETPMERRKALGLMTASTLGALAGRAVGQDSQGIIRIVVPYAAGGPNDSMARLMSESMQKTLGRTIIVDNRPGAAGLIATKNVQHAPPDGQPRLFHNFDF